MRGPMRAWSAVFLAAVFAADRAAAREGGIELESHSVNGRMVRVTLVAPVEPTPEGEPGDSIEVSFERKVRARYQADPEAASLWNRFRLDDFHELAYTFEGPFEGRMRFVHRSSSGEALGDPLDVDVEIREGVVQVHEETVGPTDAVLEPIPGFPHPLVLVARDTRFDEPLTDLRATYHLEIRGEGAADYEIGLASYRADMQLDIHWFGELLAERRPAQRPATAEEAGGEGAASGNGASAPSSPSLDLVFRGPEARVFVLAKPGAGPAVLVGRPNVSTAPTGPVRIPLEAGFSRADDGEPVVLERMRRYPEYWRFWITTASPLDSPWRREGGTLACKALVRDGEDWLEVGLPFAEVHWVKAGPTGRRWTVTGRVREETTAAPMKLAIELECEEAAGTVEVDLE